MPFIGKLRNSDRETNRKDGRVEEGVTGRRGVRGGGSGRVFLQEGGKTVRKGGGVNRKKGSKGRGINRRDAEDAEGEVYGCLY
jgi:hypothetical protein